MSYEYKRYRRSKNEEIYAADFLSIVSKGQKFLRKNYLDHKFSFWETEENIKYLSYIKFHRLRIMRNYKKYKNQRSLIQFSL